ncbi:SRPBCC family protein [Tumebacillus amylolyticus]|nr:SRPBCC family protein [Tumebacillus amylolyticus]
MLEKVGEQYVVRFERKLKHPVELVWAVLTDPEKLVQWLAKADVELVAGGKYELRFQNTDSVMLGVVQHAEAPNLLVYTWCNEGDEKATVVRWELEATEDGTLLVLTHTFDKPDALASFMAGWHVHLDILSSILNDIPMEWPWQRWEEWNKHYQHTL